MCHERGEAVAFPVGCKLMLSVKRGLLRSPQVFDVTPVGRGCVLIGSVDRTELVGLWTSHSSSLRSI